jgi:serine/threonine protein kinase
MWACGIMMYILIEGKHPIVDLATDTEKTFLKKLKDPKFKFSSKFSDLSKDLFLKLCTISPIERYTSDQATRHPWITRNFDGPIPLT